MADKALLVPLGHADPQDQTDQTDRLASEASLVTRGREVNLEDQESKDPVDSLEGPDSAEAQVRNRLVIASSCF